MAYDALGNFIPGDEVSNDGPPPKKAAPQLPSAAWLDAISEPVNRSAAKPAPEDNTYDMSEYAPPADETRMQRLKRLGMQTVKESSTPISAGAMGAGETALQMATGAIATPLAGLYGLYKTATSGPEAGAQAVEKTQRALTYEPKSSAGQLASEMASLPMTLANEYLGKAGGYVGEKFGNESLGQTIGESALPVATALYGGKAMMKSANAPKTRVPESGKDYTPLRELTPEQEARYQQQKRVGVNPTLGSVTRDPEQFRFEEQTAKMPAGRALREREVETNAALAKAVEDTDKMREGRRTTENTREVGQSVARALETKAKDSLENVSALYKAARDSGETKAAVDVKPIERWLKDHEAEATSVPEIRSVSSKLDALKAAGKGQVTIDDLENLYKAAGQLGEPGKASGKFMRDVKDLINKTTEGAGGDLYRDARAARLRHAFEFEDRSAIANLIEKKAGSRTDYKTANEDVFRKTVVNSSLTELQDVTNSLLSVDPKKHPQAIQAVRELQAETIDHLLQAATKSIGSDEKGAATFSPAGYRAAVRTIGRDKLDHLLGPQSVTRLDDILQAARDTKTKPGTVSGSDTYLNIRTEAARIAKEEAAHHLLQGIPGVGKLLSGYGKWREGKRAAAATEASVQEALTPTKASPADIAARAAEERKKNKQYQLGELRDFGRSAAPAAYVGAQQSEEAQQ